MAENQNVSKSAEKLVGSDVWGVTYVQEKFSGILGPKVAASEPRPLFLRVLSSICLKVNFLARPWSSRGRSSDSPSGSQAAPTAQAAQNDELISWYAGCYCISKSNIFRPDSTVTAKELVAARR